MEYGMSRRVKRGIGLGFRNNLFFLRHVSRGDRRANSPVGSIASGSGIGFYFGTGNSFGGVQRRLLRRKSPSLRLFCLTVGGEGYGMSIEVKVGDGNHIMRQH